MSHYDEPGKPQVTLYDHMEHEQKAEKDEQIAYCVKCKAKRTMHHVTASTAKNGRPMLKGICGSCGGGVTKLTAGAKTGAKAEQKS